MSLTEVSQWFDQTGIKLALGVCPTVSEDRGLGLTAVKEIKPSSQSDCEVDNNRRECVAVFVPSELVLNAQRITEISVDDVELRKWITVDNCEGVQRLHRGLLYLWTMEKQNAWTGYFTSLPKDVDLPFSYGIRAMQGLDSSAVSLHHAAMMKRLDIEKNYERFMKSEVGQNAKITLEQWLVPHMWISSRGLSHPITNETCLVPAIDLCNHSSSSSNVRYDLDEEGNFELIVESAEVPASQELCLDYGSRSSGEFVFNYGFIPEDMGDEDFDEIFKVYDPSDDEIRSILDPKPKEEPESGDGTLERLSHYEVLLDFFSEDLPQVLRLIRLPKLPEQSRGDEKSRYRFHSNFLMALAAAEKLRVETPDGEDAYMAIGEQRVTPTTCFERILADGDTQIVARAKGLAAKLCKHFQSQVTKITDQSSVVSKLATAEAKIYGEFARLNIGAE